MNEARPPNSEVSGAGDLTGPTAVARTRQTEKGDGMMVPAEHRMRKITNLVQRIDLTTLHLFVVVCEAGNLTRAASRQEIAPCALSKRLTSLERTRGVDLFMRNPTGMALTPGGEWLLHHARLMLLIVENITVELSEYEQGVCLLVRMLANLAAPASQWIIFASGDRRMPPNLTQSHNAERRQPNA
jgi:hypothetical protein